MTRFLSQIKIGPHIFKVKLQPLTAKRRKKKRNHYLAEYFGEASFTQTEIRIEETANKSVQLETLMHEIGHIIMDETKLDQLFDLTERQEEILVQSMAMWYTLILFENPQLLELIKKYGQPK